MSRLTDLLRRAAALDPQLGADLDSEFRILADRRAFGLNFERHQPEAVELPGRPVRRGDKVRVLSPRGSVESADKRLWRVTQVAKPDEVKVATLKRVIGDELEEMEALVEDLVVVAEFRDPVYPGLVSTGSVQRGGDKPFHTVINGENFHALQTLLYTHRGKVDCIYIDPPYNSGAKDWKYNNDYVDNDDSYRHSKWLAMMERRLVLARDLMNPDDSVLIVAIDEKEYLRLGLLLEQLFSGFKIQMISSVINPRGIVRANEFSRSNEFIFFVWTPGTQLAPVEIQESQGQSVAWETMRRRSTAGVRGRRGRGACGPNQFYAIHVDETTGHIVGRGDPLPLSARIEDYVPPRGCVAVFPARDDGMEMNWSLTDAAFDDRWPKGYVRAGRATPERKQRYIMQYILGGVIEDIDAGRVEVKGRNPDGSVIAEYVEKKTIMAHTQWEIPSHNAQQHGTGLLVDFLPDRKFPYAKSLYAVEDALRFFVSSKPQAVVVDFFAGSGTTAHAVMRLNRRDGGHRQCISITNNEVSVDEQVRLRGEGLRAGDGGWEAFGICDYITKPRIIAAVTGAASTGSAIEGTYQFVDAFPMSNGFEENVEFFTLTYNSPAAVGHNRAFGSIAPLLWLRAGAVGRRIEAVPATSGWDVTDAYGVLVNLDNARAFVKTVAGQPAVRLAFIVTDDDRRFQMICRSLPEHVQPVRLYESYFLNFEINTGESS